MLKKKWIGVIMYIVGATMFSCALFPSGRTVTGIVMLIFSLFSIFIGLRFFQPIAKVKLLGIVMLIFSLFSIFMGSFFFGSSWLQIYYRIAQILILISGFIYLLSIIFLFKLKNWARKTVLAYSIVLISYFVPLSVYLFSDPWGWGGFMAFSFSPYMLLPLFFIIILVRPQVKELFKK